MRVRLFPASDIVRSALSSSSDHRSCCLRVNIIVASKASEAGPSFGMSTDPVRLLITAAGCQLNGGLYAPAYSGDISKPLFFNPITKM
jgi:hypothetical protein